MSSIDLTFFNSDPLSLFHNNIRDWRKEFPHQISSLEKKVHRDSETVFERCVWPATDDWSEMIPNKTQEEEELEVLVDEGRLEEAVERAKTVTDDGALAFLVLQLLLEQDWDRAHFFANNMVDSDTRDWYLKYVRDTEYFCLKESF